MDELKASVLSLLPSLVRHQHGHRVVKRLRREGSARDRKEVRHTHNVESTWHSFVLY